MNKQELVAAVAAGSGDSKTATSARRRNPGPRSEDREIYRGQGVQGCDERVVTKTWLDAGASSGKRASTRRGLALAAPG